MPRPPRSFLGFRGQVKPIRRLIGMADGSKKKGHAFPDFQLNGPPGTGKSALGRALALYLGVSLTYLQAARDMKTSTVFAALTQLKYGDIFFLDEAHAAPESIQEYFYLPMDERKIAKVGKDAGALVSLPEFTLICATNWPKRLAVPFRSRLISIPLDPYSLEELRAIAQQRAEEDRREITGQAATLIAKTVKGSRTSHFGTPRDVRKLVKEIFFHFPERQKIGVEEVEAVLSLIGIEDGLWPVHREYMSILQNLGGTCSLERLMIGRDRRYYLEDVEPLLVCRRLIDVTDRGRFLTAQGALAISATSQEPDGFLADSSQGDI